MGPRPGKFFGNTYSNEGNGFENVEAMTEHLFAERLQSSSCSAVATVGTPSSPRSIRSGISSVSHVGLPNTIQTGLLFNTTTNTTVTNISDQNVLCPILDASPHSPPSRQLPIIKRPSSALSEGSIHSSTVAVGDSLPRDDELTTIDDGDSGGQSEGTEILMTDQTTTPVHLTRTKAEDEICSVMGGRKAFESSNYTENLDELGDFQVHVESQDFRFSCAHFVAYDGYREKLHGHTYTAKMSIGGRLNSDGYVVDFILCKKIVREVCKKFNEFMLIPMRSDVLSIKKEGGSIHLTTQDGAQFMFPESDCLCLPIMHSTAEEIAAHFWDEIVQAFTPQFLQDRGVGWIEIIIAEKPTQYAQYRRHIPIVPPTL